MEQEINLKENVLIDKKQIRAIVREKKRQLSNADINLRTEKILKHLYEMKRFKDAQNIFTYVNYNQEVNTLILIEECFRLGKNVFVPKVIGDEMDFFQIHSLDELESGAYGILEPIEGCKTASENKGLMIMPGLAFDEKHRRIGYGGGFYDKYLEKLPEFYKIALCYDFQVFNKIVTDKFDIPVDLVISETHYF